MSTYQSKNRRAPHAQDRFWADERNWFWTYNGFSYTEKTLKHFQEIAQEAIDNEGRWSKPDNELRLHARK